MFTLARGYEEKSDRLSSCALRTSRKDTCLHLCTRIIRVGATKITTFALCTSPVRLQYAGDSALFLLAATKTRKLALLQHSTCVAQRCWQLCTLRKRATTTRNTLDFSVLHVRATTRKCVRDICLLHEYTAKRWDKTLATTLLSLIHI